METGHLVFATIHTNTAPQTIDRIVDSFLSHPQNQICQQLPGVILGVIFQRLLPRADGADQADAGILIPSLAENGGTSVCRIDPLCIKREKRIFHCFPGMWSRIGMKRTR